MATTRKGPPAPPAPPPPSGSKGKTQQSAINALLTKYPAYRQWMVAIRKAASRWGIDPIFVLATLAWENGAANAKVVNSSGAAGLAQMVDRRVSSRNNQQQYQTFIAQYGDRFVNGHDQALNPVWAINYIAWRMTGHVRQYGSLDAAYSRGYNPGFSGDSRGKGPSALIPKWYLGQAKEPASPQDTAAKSVETAAAKAQLLSGQAFLQKKLRIDTIYEAYTGKRATNAEARRAINNGWSDYHLELTLSKSARFLNSPVWKTHAPSYAGVWHDMYGAERKPPTAVIAYAIIHNLDGAGFQDLLRRRKDYVTSNAFNSDVAGYDAIYRKIYGAPNTKGSVVIKQAVLNGWSQDQFAKYLRTQPEYTGSQEYQSGVMGLLGTLGGVTGQGVTLHQGTTPPRTGPAATAPKTDPRVKGQGGIDVQGTPYTASLGG